MSAPDFEATYCTAKDPVFEPDEGEMPLPRSEVRDQELAFVTQTDSVPLAPCCREEGPMTEAVGSGTMLRTVTASSPSPHALAARPE